MPSACQMIGVRARSLLRPRCAPSADWLRAHPEARREAVRAAGAFEVPPSVVEGLSGAVDWESPARRPMQENWVMDLPLGRVARNGVVITADGTLLPDVHQDFPSGGSGDWRTHRFLRRLCHVRLWPARAFAGRMGVVATHMDHNYFHFLTDALPRFVLLEGSSVDAFYAPQRSAFQREAYALLGIPEERILPSGGKRHWCADTLVVPSLANPPQVSPPWVVQFLRDLRDRALGALPQATEKLYVSRADAGQRQVTNEAEIEAALAARGFRKVVLTGMPLAEQMRLFASAAQVVAVHGAGMTNLVFSQPGTKVVELTPSTWIAACFRHICAGGAMPHALVVSPPPAAGHPLDQVVDPRKVFAALDRLG